MKTLKIFQFELVYQLRRLTTWLFFVAVAAVAFLLVRGGFLADALYGDFFVNAPFIIAFTTVISSLFWVVVAAAVSGEVAARDAETGMHPLTYTTPVSKLQYLGGRFLAAFVLNALIMLAVPAGIMLAVYSPGVDREVIGPFRPVAYLSAYGFLALPNAFIGTSIQFAWAALGRRTIASYFGSLLVLLMVYGGIFAILFFLERQDLAALFDIFGHIFITSEMTLGWTPIQKNTRLIALEGMLLHSRLLWVGIAIGTLAFTYARFRFEHLTISPWWSWITRQRSVQGPRSADNDFVRVAPVPIPRVRQSFGFATCIRQVLLIAMDSFRTIAKRRGGLVVSIAIAAITVLVVPLNMENLGTPLLPRTEYVLTFLTAHLTDFLTPWVIIPLLIVLYAGELVWREREAGLGEITDAAPVPEWVLFSGKFMGLSLVLLMWMGFLMAAGMLIQLRMGYYRFETGLYLKVLFGLRLPEYMLFTVLALFVQGLVNQKYLGLLLAVIAYAFILFASLLGLQHHLLVYGSAPAWSYTDMRGFGATLWPWLSFMCYWAAWALLLTIAARLLWVRGLEKGLQIRLQLARSRFSPPVRRASAAVALLILVLGGYIFYNTNVLNKYRTTSDGRKMRADYERRYAKFKDIPQPRLAGTRLHVELYPHKRAVNIRGSYRLVNSTTTAIDSIHVAPVPGVVTSGVSLDRAATRVLDDVKHGHQIYALKTPLQPGDSLQLNFEVRVEPRGFRNSGVNPFMSVNISYFKSEAGLPAIGYQAGRELLKPGERRAEGLAQRPLVPTLANAEASQDITGEAVAADAEHISFEAVIGTDEGQTAIAPGVLQRTWTNRGRRYFHYLSDAPVGSSYAFFSAAYALHEEHWTPPAGAGQPVTIQVFHHPQHSANLDRMLRSVRASLNYYTRAFGPYPHGRIIRLIENPGGGMGAHAEPTTIDYTEGFSRFNPAQDPRGLDLPFAVIAHEMAHQWQAPYALAEGLTLLSESFAWYAGMGVVEESYGRVHLRRLLRFFRQPYPITPIRQSVPLLRAMDPYAAYRKGPFALFALSEYMGREKVDLAFRRLITSHRSGAPPLPTSLDLYRELQAVTPDSLRYLLHDLLAENTFWKLETKQAAAEKMKSGAWQVTLRIKARKITVDPAGNETEVPVDEWIPVGIFAPTVEGTEFGEILYLGMHRIRSGEQTVTVTVQKEPADAGIDPYHLLIDLEPFDNVERVKK